jgi:Poly(R)-hydroxyalkanoic acid synthase subunit (PHA_synth_III_E)
MRETPPERDDTKGGGAMGTSDYPWMQKDFAKSLSDWTARVTSAWNKNAAGTGAAGIFNLYRDSPAGRISPSPFWGMTDPSEATTRLRGMIDSAYRDLPDLLKKAGDSSAVKHITDKWTESYEKTLREMLGLPAKTDAERLLDFWKACASTVEGFQHGLDPFGPLRAFAQGRRSSFAPASLGAYGDWMKAWTETCEQTINRLFQAPGMQKADTYGEKAKQAFDAQIEFVKSLAAFQEQLAGAAGNALTKIARHANELGMTEVTPEVREHFYRIWLSFSEDALTDLFESESFAKTVSASKELGMDARMKMEDFVTEVRSFLDVPSQRESDKATRAVEDMDKRVRQLEDEIQVLREKISALST